MRHAAKVRDVSVNDVFMTALLHGAAAYHRAEGRPASTLNTTFVVSTRSDRAEGGNAFTPVRVTLPAGDRTIDDRLTEVSRRVAEQRDSVSGAYTSSDV